MPVAAANPQIHQDLPYGTMEDDEMRNMNIGCLQDHGVIFLWVTGGRCEAGRAGVLAQQRAGTSAAALHGQTSSRCCNGIEGGAGQRMIG